MNSTKTSSLVVAAGVLTLFVCYGGAGNEIQIDKAYCGAEGSWRDVTAFLQRELEGDTLSVTIEQPFEEIGGDPAPGKGKIMIVDYRFNGRPYRLLFEERYPVAFTINLPSPEAAAPGADARASAIMADISAHPAVIADLSEHQARRVKQRLPSSVSSFWQNWNHSLNEFAIWASLIAIVCAGTALVQIHQIKRQLRKARNPQPGAAPDSGTAAAAGD